MAIPIPNTSENGFMDSVTLAPDTKEVWLLLADKDDWNKFSNSVRVKQVSAPLSSVRILTEN